MFLDILRDIDIVRRERIRLVIIRFHNAQVFGSCGPGIVLGSTPMPA